MNEDAISLGTDTLSSHLTPF